MLKVAVIKHRSFLETPTQLIGKINAAAQRGVQIILGPEYSLFCSQYRINTLQENSKLEDSLREISNENRCVIVPGTLPKTVQQSIQMACPVFESGTFIGYVAKKSDRGDTEILRKMNQTRTGAKQREADFKFKPNNSEKTIGVYICGDQGRYNFELADIELVTSYDSSSSVHTHIGVPLVSRHVFISNGLTGDANGFFCTNRRNFENTSIKINSLPIRQTDPSFKVYHIK